MNPARAAVTLAASALLVAAAAAMAGAACGRSSDAAGARGPESREPGEPRAGAAPSSTTAAAADPGVIDLLPLLRQGSIDVAGPVVDLGEAQSNAYLLPPLPVASETVNGDSWVGVGPRLRVRVAINASAPPSAIRLRVRNVGVRGVVAIVDGLLARQAVLPQLPRPYTVTLPISPDRFRRDVSEVELRFFGVARTTTSIGARVLAAATGRSASTLSSSSSSTTSSSPSRTTSLATTAAPRAGAQLASAGAAARAPAPPARPLIELDWVHLVRDQTLEPHPVDPRAPPPLPPPPPPPSRRRARSASSSRRPPAPPLPPVWVTDPMSATRPDSLAGRPLVPPTVRVNDLVADVRADATPRRALTLYAPGALSFVTVVPPRATLRAALGADGIRGASNARPVAAHVRVEADGAAPLELRAEVEAGAPWRDVALDLASLAGKAVRVTVRAEQGGDTRLAVADPRVVTRADGAPAPRAPPPVAHVLFVVLRGARLDRFLPALSPRLSAGGFSRLVREGLVAPAISASPRPLAALASAVTGLPADVHGMGELTDTLDESAPTPGSLLTDAGVATASFSDDRWWDGSGLDRGMTERGGCAGEAAFCRAGPVIVQAGEWLARQGDRRACAFVMVRAGAVPMDPQPELLTAIDPSPYEGAATPERISDQAANSRRGALALEQRQTDRIAAVYDAVLAGIDHGLATALDRLRDAGTLANTAVVVVGDRGTALGDSGYVGEGPANLSLALGVVSQTVLIVRAPGLAPGTLGETASVLDAVATVLERLGATPGGVHPGERAGAASLVATRGASVHPRGVVVVATARGDLGLRFGELLALGRGAGGLALYQPESDPLGQSDLAPQRPIARAFADAVIGAYRSSAGEEPASSRVVYSPSTRALPPNVETGLRNMGLLRR